MKKMVRLAIFCSLTFLIFPIQKISAEEQAAILSKANIEVIANGDDYSVTETVIIENLNGAAIEHTVKETTDNTVENVSFTSDGSELKAEVTSGELLHRYSVQPPDDRADFEYTIEYTVSKTDKNFDVPLFVPEYATAGDDHIVQLSFQAPEGMKIQKNSFPVVNDSGLNAVEKNMENIPAIAKYVYAEKTILLNSFNIISFLAIFGIFALLIGWGIREKNKGGQK